MAFRRDALKQVGGFDCALAAGTVTCGGEDGAMISTLMMRGATIVYQPSAIVHHYHRASGDAVRNHLARAGGRHGDLSGGFPRDLLRANRKGFRQGWFAYTVARVRAWRMRRAEWAGTP